MIEVAEKPHAEKGPSGWHTWGNCPGSIVLSEGLVTKTSSYAKEGTAAHQLLEMCVVDRSDAEFHLGEEIIVEGEVFVVDQEMADAVNSSIDVVYSYKKSANDVLMAEQTVPLAFMTGEEGAEGTSDVAIITENGTHLIIADFKYGKGVQVYASEKHDLYTGFEGPDAIKDRNGEVVLAHCKRCHKGEIELDEGCHPNGQLAMYALGWLQKHGFVYEDIEKVTLVVLQPRLEWVDEYTISVEELRAFENVIREAAGAVELARQTVERIGGIDLLDLNPSEKACKFCKAKAHCPALKNVVSTSLATLAQPSDPTEFADLTLPKQAAAVTVNEGVTNEKLAEFMRAVPLMESAIEAVRAEVERRLFDGQEIEGFYLGVGRKGRRTWKNEETALKELTKSGRLKMSEAQAKKPISPTQAEKLLKDRPQVWAKIAPQIDQSEGKPSVCREGDSNPRYQIVSPPEAFANLDAPLTIAQLKGANGTSGIYIEASDGMTHAIITEEQSRSLKVGDPWPDLRVALAASIDLEDAMS